MSYDFGRGEDKGDGERGRTWTTGGSGRGLLASGPCHLNFSLNFKINTKFVIQIGDLPQVYNSPNFAGR
jgi:hypothetical protein